MPRPERELIERVLATAGHVDHGKSALVHALTGVDPDRWEEEQRRGMTIDLGFAHVAPTSDTVVTFIDVPGHIDFLRNMIAGLAGVDGCVFIVAADDGWMPQSEEHLRILQLLGVERGIVAVTKSDLVDEDLLELAMAEVADRVAGTFLDGAPIIAVSARRGDGLEALRAALAELVSTSADDADRARPRLWVDRVFTIQGSGTVVTGSLRGGRFTVDDDVELAPTGARSRIRALQLRGRAVDVAASGTRVAANLVGIERMSIRRGDVLVHPQRWSGTACVDASVEVLGSLRRPIGRRGAYVVYVGTRAVAVQLRLIGAGEIAPGSTGFARIFLPEPLPLLPGDRYVLRESGRSITVGGGEILDIAPVRKINAATPDRSIDRVVRERGWIDVHELELLTGAAVEPTVGRWAASEQAFESARSRLDDAVRSAGPAGLRVAELGEFDRAVVAALDSVVVTAGVARHASVPDLFDDHPAIRILRDGGLTPSPPDADRATLRELVRRGLVLESGGIVFHPDAVERAADAAAGLLASSPDGFTVSSFCAAAGTSRKFALPLLNELDRRGVLRRAGDRRIAGPRMAKR